MADAAVAVRGDLSEFHNDLRGADKGVQSLGARLKGILSPANLVIGAAAVGAVVVAGLADAARALIDIERLNAQTDAVIRSTGGAANVTRDGIEEMAEALERTTTIEREAVQEGANLLLTFTNIRNEAGENNDIFDQATESVLDMSVAMGTDARSAAMQLGKALNDPVAGMAQLGRAGVQFTDEQKALVAALVETGDILGAQKVILAELETQFGGSAEAFAGTTAGKIQKFQNDIGNFFESVILGAIKVTDALAANNPFANAARDIDNFAMDFGDRGADIHRLAEGVGTDFQTMKDRIKVEMAESGASFEEAVAKMELDALNASTNIPDRMSEAVRAGADAIRLGGPVVAEEAGKIAGMLPSEIQARVDDVRRAGMDSVVAFAAGILDKQNDPLLAMEALVKANEEALTRSAEITRLLGQLHSQELANGLNDGRVEVRLAAEAARAVIIDRLSTLDASGWGYNVGASFAAGMDGSIPLVEGAARGIASATGRQISIRSEPPDHSSPLYGITKWGGNIVRTIADGIYGELGMGRAAGAALAGSLVPGFGTVSLASASGAANGGPVGGNSYNVQLVDRMEVRTVEDIGYGLKRLGDLGKLPGSK